jgi:tetratricopeptide (TPR) repeat protein
MDKTICLNMIVKNESKIILRLLSSVKDIIDCYCICDTGSTDNTKQIIEMFFNKYKIPGKIVEKEFVDFGTNRTYALEQAKGMADYALFLDADMILKVGPRFSKKLIYDIYNVPQGNDSFVYCNTRMVSLNKDIKVVCPTHEYYDIPQGCSNITVDKEFLFIEDIGDGGCKDDKYERDIRLLTKALETEPDNCRYLFYTANSYFCLQKYEDAIKYYKKHTTLNPWGEEKFYSFLRIGVCYKHLENECEMLKHYLKAYITRPTRMESLYEIVHYYRCKGDYILCNYYYDIAKKIKMPNDILFVHKDEYTYKLDLEYSIFAYYVGIRELSKFYSKLFDKAPVEHHYMMLNNYKFYKKVLNQTIKSIQIKDNFTRKTIDEEYDFISSSPSIVQSVNGGYIMNLRLVNYRINTDGSYPYYKYITTHNKFIEYDQDFNTVKSSYIEQEFTSPRQYLGIEDIKLINYKTDGKDDIYFTGTCYKSNDKLGICMGKYSHKELKFQELSTKNESECEKNWVFVPIDDPDDRKIMVYKWFPLTFGFIETDNKLVVNKGSKLPNIFYHARGSTNGFRYNNEIWFVVHMVHQNSGEPRQYYHMLAVFDKNMNYSRHSPPFKFTDSEIEYCLGLIVEDKRVIMTYSIWDRESHIKIYDKSYIDEMFKEE